eukprot:TRINITY_DN260_c1_g1_i1.p1 TRINITY_DN260_c1_g1~~TRINITY_DN260_c1_g1_i1.p1  ORF type:complete len:896 (-),score=250.63 TRINITY_DN260_c1_g1_i1:12-2699(-)
MLSSSKGSQRFSLLLLDEGEYYFDDFSGFYYPPSETDELSFKRRVKGRLKLCSLSVIFDPDDHKLPITRIPFKLADTIEPWQGPLLSFLPAKADLFVIHSSGWVEMKENNANAPYVFREERRDHRFSLNYVSLSNFLSRVNALYTLSRIPPEVADQELRELIEEREAAMTFDTSALEDINEQILIEKRGVRVTPLVNNPGEILITNAVVYFQPFNNISINTVEKIPLSSIMRISKRRYVLRNVGIEIFMNSDQSVFFAFKTSQIRDAVYDTLIKQPVVLKNLSKDDQMNMTLKWQNAIISNYEYLMYLNNMAGRTFNDITQYPVFPWVLADYSSPVLDLDDPATFRDLSKPIGALNPERLKMLKERMSHVTEKENKFLYGTHYSAPGYVLFYLVRQAPEYMLRLQNGKFDAPGRMFHSIAETWSGVLNNPADVKELIPEFYDPSKCFFLLNTERLNLGIKDNGARIDDVVLPQWAAGAEDFVKKCREALESDYVSENIHHWIDLIFGYKQQGDEAVAADNVFYHLTYEGAVDIDAIRDPFQRAAIIAQIKEFGQTPKQLFFTPHPQRLPKTSRVAHIPITQSFSVEHLDIPSLLLSPNVWNLDKLEMDFSYKLHKDLITSCCLSSDGKTHFSVAQDSSLKIYSLEEKKQIRSVNICELTLSSCVLSQDQKVVIMGSWDNNIYTYNIDYGKVGDAVSAHDDAVSALCMRRDLLVSGSWDATVKTWKYSQSGLSRLPIVDFTDFETEVHCVDVDSSGMIIAAGTADGNVTLLDTRTKSPIRTVQAHQDVVNAVRFTPDGIRFISCSNDDSFKVFEVNGNEMFSSDVGEKLRCLTTDGKTLLIGGDNGFFRVWDIESGKETQHPKEYPENVMSVVCADDGSTVVAGCGGVLRVYTSKT